MHETDGCALRNRSASSTHPTMKVRRMSKLQSCGGKREWREAQRRRILGGGQEGVFGRAWVRNEVVHKEIVGLFNKKKDTK